MIVKEIIFDNSKILSLVNNFNSICINCDNIGIGCSICPVDATKSILETTKLDININFELKNYKLLNPSEDSNNISLEFNKNDIMITQNSLEDICTTCSYVGSYCIDCSIHQVRRDLASLPLKEIKMDMIKKEKSAKSCGTSCSTGGCSTKKKK